jgi:hypothetical protein
MFFQQPQQKGRNVSKLKLFSGILLAGFMLVGASGCRTYMVKATVEINEKNESKPDVSWAPRWEKSLPAEKSIVVHAPEPETVAIYSVGPKDEAAERIAVGTAQANQGKEGDLLTRDASVWISELERQLMRKGYRVLSRQQYHALLREQKAANQESAASALGADFIIQINALEYRPNLLDGTSMHIVLEHYITDPDGTNPRPANIMESRNKNTEKNSTEVRTSQMRADTVLRVIQNKYLPAFCSVFMDAKVIEVQTGEVINSYRIRQDLVLGTDSELFFYFKPGFHSELGLFDPSAQKTPTGAIKHVATLDTGRQGGLRDHLLDHAVRTVCAAYIDSLTQK